MIHPLEKYRIEHNLTLEELGMLIDVEKGNLSRMIESGSGIRSKVCERIKKSIGIDITPNKRFYKQSEPVPIEQAEPNNINIEQNDLMPRIIELNKQLEQLTEYKDTLLGIIAKQDDRLEKQDDKLERQEQMIDQLQKELIDLRSQLGNSSHLNEERTA